MQFYTTAIYETFKDIYRNMFFYNFLIICILRLDLSNQKNISQYYLTWQPTLSISTDQIIVALFIFGVLLLHVNYTWSIPEFY